MSYSPPTLQHVSQSNKADSAPALPMPTPEPGSKASQQAAATTQAQAADLAAEGLSHAGHGSQTSKASVLQGPRRSSVVQSTLYQLRNRSLSRALPSSPSSMPPASLDFLQTADAVPGPASAAADTGEGLHSQSEASAKNKQAIADPTGPGHPVYANPSTSDHPLYDQQGSDSCTSDDELPSPISYLRLHMRTPRNTTARAVSPPPGFENVIPQPREKQDCETAAGPSRHDRSISRESGSDHEGYACDRWPRPDGSHRHITEKGKRRQKRRALARKQARQAQRLERDRPISDNESDTDVLGQFLAMDLLEMWRSERVV